jgi:hypothetical protein
MAQNPKRKGSGSQVQGTPAKRSRWEDDLAMAPSECSPTAALSGVHSAQISGGSFTVIGSSSSTTIHNTYNYGPKTVSEDILLLLRSLSLPNFRDIQLDTLSKATDGTCLWLTQGHIFLLWIKNGRIMWGIGIRKSLICQILLDAHGFL